MVLQQMSETDQQTKDNLGARDSTMDQSLLWHQEAISFEEGPTIIEKRLVGTAFILGHSANGVLGTSTLGEGTLGSWVYVWIVNPDNIFHEHFRDNYFYDSTNSSNVSWDTTNFRLEFANNGVGITNPIFYNNKEIASVKVVLDSFGLKMETQIDETNYPGGRQVNLT